MIEMITDTGVDTKLAPIHALALTNRLLDQVEPASCGKLLEARFAANRPTEMEVYYERELQALRCKLRPNGRASFTPMLLADMRKMQTTVEQAFRETVERPFEYLIMSSLTPGIFNLGGDLGLFREKIEVRDEAALRVYAYDCVAAVFSHYCGFEHRVTTIALIQGDALGGGFEAALASDILVAERQSQMGFPEILFNLFPGMGAYSFLCRRIGVAKTEEMLRTGNIYSAAQLYDLGVVDMLVEPGEGENAVRELIRKNKPRQNALSALYQVRRRVNPITLEELKDIADIWVAAALRLGESDLRRMSRITAAQDKARARCVAESTVAN